MTRLRCTAAFLVALALTGCDKDAKPDEGRVDAKVTAGAVGPVPHASIEITIKGVDTLLAKAVDWVKGVVVNFLEGKRTELTLTREQIDALKRGEKVEGKSPDGHEYVLTPKKE
jgi:hypothetical protein